MIQNNTKINSYQLSIIIMASVLGVALLELPSDIAEKVGSEAWIVIMLSGVIIMLGVFITCFVSSKLKGNSLVSISKNLCGDYLGVLLILPLVIALFIANIIELKLFTITVKVFLLDKTPVSFILLPFLLIVMLIVRSEFKHIIRFLEFVFPFIILVIIVLSLLTLTGTDFSNLLPVFQKDLTEYIGGIEKSLFSFLGIMVLIILYPYLQKKDFKSGFKASFYSTLFLIILYTSVVALCLTKLGALETNWIVYPTVSLIKSAYIPGGFIERLEGVLMSIWVLIVFSTVIITLYCFCILVADIFKIQSRKLIITITIPLVHMFCFLLYSTFKMYKLSAINNLVLGVYCIYILPIILFIAYKIKSRKRGEIIE